MIHNSFHNIHLNTAMLLSKAFVPEKMELVGLAELVQTVVLCTEQGNRSYTDIPEVHNKKHSFPFFKHIQGQK